MLASTMPSSHPFLTAYGARLDTGTGELATSEIANLSPRKGTRSSRARSPLAASALTAAGSRLGWPRYCGPSSAGGEPSVTGGEPRVTRRSSTRAAGMRSCSRASRASARASAAVGRLGSRARGHSRA